MKNLIILAHPIEDSFNFGLTKAVTKKLQEKGEEVIIRNLYKMNFQPVFTFDEMNEIKNGNLSEDISIEQNYIKECDNIILIYPLWWTSMPAILKGYIDRVFSYGFAYCYNKEGSVDGLLSGKKVLNITTHGTPNNIYDDNGMTKSLNQTIDTGIFEFCGFEVEEHIFLGEVPFLSEEDGKKVIESVVTKI